MICLLQVDGGHATDEEISKIFDVKTVTNVGMSTVVQLKNLNLSQNQKYFIYVMGMLS